MSHDSSWQELRDDQGREIAGWLRYVREEYGMEPCLTLHLREHPKGGLFYEICYSAHSKVPDGARKRYAEGRRHWPTVQHKSLWGAVYAACLHLSDLCDDYRRRHPIKRSDR